MFKKSIVLKYYDYVHIFIEKWRVKIEYRVTGELTGYQYLLNK